MSVSHTHLRGLVVKAVEQAIPSASPFPPLPSSLSSSLPLVPSPSPALSPSSTPDAGFHARASFLTTLNHNPHSDFHLLLHFDRADRFSDSPPVPADKAFRHALNSVLHLCPRPARCQHVLSTDALHAPVCDAPAGGRPRNNAPLCATQRHDHIKSVIAQELAQQGIHAGIEQVFYTPSPSAEPELLDLSSQLHRPSSHSRGHRRSDIRFFHRGSAVHLDLKIASPVSRDLVDPKHIDPAYFFRAAARPKVLSYARTLNTPDKKAAAPTLYPMVLSTTGAWCQDSKTVFKMVDHGRTRDPACPPSLAIRFSAVHALCMWLANSWLAWD